MIDLHSHVIPGIDDGPPDMSGAVGLADAAAAAGTTVMVATPHVREDHPDVVVDEIRGRVAEVNEALARQGVPLEVLPGAEVAITSVVGMSDPDLAQVTLGGVGRHLLIETPFGDLPLIFDEIVADLLTRGWVPVIAHPEHNHTLRQDLKRLGGLIERGALVQVTSDSLAASRPAGPRSREVALEMLRRGWITVLASDTHSAQWRPPDLRPGLKGAQQARPDMADELRWMVTDAPGAIVRGEPPPPRPPRAPMAPRNLADRLLRRRGRVA